MAKKSRKQAARQKRDSAGCMSGLISIFDFRQGRYTQRLLTDKKLGSKHGRGTSYSNNKFDVLRDLEDIHEDTIDTDPKEIGRVDSTKASIKALIEEEMSGSYISKNISTKFIKARSQLVSEANLEKTHKQKSKKREVGSDCDANESLASQSTCPDLSENTPFDINLAELMEVFCSENNKCNDENNVDNVGDWKHNFLSELDLQCTLDHSNLQKALYDFAKSLSVQKSMDSKQSIGNGEIQSNEFMDALEMLNSNKELFLKLLQDPDPHPMKLILELQNPQVGDGLHGIREEQQVSHNLSSKQTGHHFFKKKDKSKGAKPLHESSSHASSRIVLLRPSPGRSQQNSNTSSPAPSPNLHHNSENQQGNEKGSFQFTLKEIKRRVKNMIGESKKVRHLITMDGILHKVPYGYQNSDDTVSSYCSPEHTSRISKLLKKGNKKDNTKEHQPQLNWKDTTVSNPLYREPVVFYEEAKKHLVEMVNAGGEIGILPKVRASIPLGRLLSLPEYNSLSPWLSPEREEGNDSLKRTYSDNMDALSESIEHSRSTASNPVDDSQALDSNLASFTIKLQIGEDMIQKGNNEIEEFDNIEVATECSSRPVFFSEGCEIEESFVISEMGTHEVPQPVIPSVSILPNFVTAQKAEALESTMETPDHPSPVSVLESINSPHRTRIESRLRGAQQLHFDENEAMALDQTLITSEANSRTITGDKNTKLEYVRAVLESSGLSLMQLTEKSQSPNQLLDPFVFDEVEIAFGQQIDDSRLLFDCVNEVLVEIHERNMSCTPWGSFIRPNIGLITTGRNFVQAVCRKFDRYLFLQFPCTLDQVVKKDLDYLAWMDIQFETERTIAETGEVILEYIMEETILELWD